MKIVQGTHCLECLGILNEAIFPDHGLTVGITFTAVQLKQTQVNLIARLKD